MIWGEVIINYTGFETEFEMSEHKLTEILDELSSIENQLEYLLKRGGNDEALVDRRRLLQKRILEFKNQRNYEEQIIENI